MKIGNTSIHLMKLVSNERTYFYVFQILIMKSQTVLSLEKSKEQQYSNTP